MCGDFVFSTACIYLCVNGGFMKLLSTIALAGMVILTTSTGCGKRQSSKFVVHLTDAPGDFQEVNIDILEVWVKLDKNNTGWFRLSTNKGVYNLLNYQNGISTMLATGNLPQAAVQEIRFVLGPNNSLKVDDQLYPLEIPSGAESGLKIKTSRSLISDTEHLTVDFDAAASVKLNGKDAYKLMPVLKVAN